MEGAFLVVLHALGQCLIRTAITTISPRADMCFALGSYLTRERGNRVPRRQIEKLFWPAMRAADASHSLSELIHKLRRKGMHIQRDESACIWLPRDAASIDIDQLSTEEPARLAERDLSILPGYSPRASSAFNDWVDEWRGDLHLRLLNIVVAGMTRASASSDWPVTLSLANKALKLDPEHPSALLARARAAEQLARQNRESRQAAVPGVADERAVAQLRESASAVKWPDRRTVAAANDDTALVGRTQSMERLQAQATRTFNGKVSSAYISAPTGVGKSRLIREFSAWMRSRNAVTCTVSCGNHDAKRPLSAFVQAVPRLQTLPGAAGCAPSTLACLNRITHTSGDDTSAMTCDETLYESTSTRAAVVDLVEAIADEQPLLLVVEDVHWIDSASWALLRTIATTAHGSVMIVCTSRVKWRDTAWGEPDTFAIEELSTLDATAARAHMSNRLAKRCRSTDDSFIDWCVRTSGGNPYFIEELVNFWIATGEQYTAPPSLIALVETRVANLRPDALRVLQAVAILGKNSTVELLQEVLQFPTHVLFSAIEALSEASMLAIGEGATEGAASVLCRHDMVLRAATRGLSAPGRALLHHAAASALEAVATATRSAELFWDCADHWQSAGQPDRSTLAAVACARHLHDMGLVDEAVSRCSTALQTCSGNTSRALILRAMAHSQFVAGDWRAFCNTVIEVRSLEDYCGDAKTTHDDLELWELIAQRSLHRDWNGALQMTLRCVYAYDADASHRVQAAINALKIASNISDLDTMDAVYREAAPLSLQPNVPAQHRLMLTMIYETIRGSADAGTLVARELLLFAERTLPRRHRMTIMLNCTSALRRSGLPGEAEAVCESLFQSAVQFHCHDLAAEACNRLIEMHCDSGRIDIASRWAAKYRRLRRPNEELRSRRSLRIAIARVHIWRKKWDAAHRLLESPGSRPLWEDSVVQFRTAALATKVRLGVGQDVGQTELAEWVFKLANASSLLRTTGAQDYECYSLYLGYRYLGETGLAQQFLDQYVRSERRDTRPLAPEIIVELARLESGL